MFGSAWCLKGTRDIMEAAIKAPSIRVSGLLISVIRTVTIGPVDAIDRALRAHSTIGKWGRHCFFFLLGMMFRRGSISLYACAFLLQTGITSMLSFWGRLCTPHFCLGLSPLERSNTRPLEHATCKPRHPRRDLGPWGRGGLSWTCLRNGDSEFGSREQINPDSRHGIHLSTYSSL